MSQSYVVPNIYQDLSNQAQGYFAFRFTCQECSWSVNTTPIRSTVSTATNIIDIGVGFLGGFWGRAAQGGEQIYGCAGYFDHPFSNKPIFTYLCHNAIIRDTMEFSLLGTSVLQIGDVYLHKLSCSLSYLHKEGLVPRRSRPSKPQPDEHGCTSLSNQIEG